MNAGFDRVEEFQGVAGHCLGLVFAHEKLRPRHGDEAFAVRQLIGDGPCLPDGIHGIVLTPDQRRRRRDLRVLGLDR